MTDREKIEFLRGYMTGVGHTDGTPFSDATLTLNSGRSCDMYYMREIEGLLAHLNIVGVLGAPSPSDVFVYRWLKANRVIDAFSALQEMQQYKHQ